MTKELRRLLISPGRLRAAGGGALAITETEAHYLRRVLRLGSGDPVAVVDGAGRLWTAELAPEGGLLLQQPLTEPLQCCKQPSPRIELAMAMPRRDGELVWRMATELGADRLQPLIAERSQGQERGLEAWPLERWRTIVREASEQCERLWLPELQAPSSARELLGRPPEGLSLIATTREPGLPRLEELLASLAPAGPAPRTVSLAIGPEGGWSQTELAAAEQAGWRAVSLGDPILRTATAAIAGVARLASWRALSCASFPWPSP